MTQFRDIKAVITSMKDEFTASLRKLKEDFENQLSTLKSSLTQQTVSNSDQFEEIVQEVIERQKRKPNLIVFGVPEQSSAINGSERSELDKAAVNDILTTVRPEFSISSNMKIQRLGRFQTNSRHRPIKIVLDDESEVHKFIKNAKVLKANTAFSNISLSFDKTAKQIQLYNEVKTQLNARINSGEVNLRIRYLHGVPKIVKSESFSPSLN
ncbi:hypothetical protein Zmor_021443 [Zophobas morio]|uniref:Uncharacterized protein n=1 Tax=Zophobas morio TaxID=2755281 RepID=A0AA38MAT6_9CUCU|nr:hypothetical protein Zmor_021443 [Zophobas morio]